MKKKEPTRLEELRESRKSFNQDKFDRLILDREDLELRKKFCVSGELLLHPTDQQCKDNQGLVVYAQDGLSYPRAILFPPPSTTVDYSKVKWGAAAATSSGICLKNASSKEELSSIEDSEGKWHKSYSYMKVLYNETKGQLERIKKEFDAHKRDLPSVKPSGMSDDEKKNLARDIITEKLANHTISFIDAYTLMNAL
jgi:hypothetical protein